MYSVEDLSRADNHKILSDYAVNIVSQFAFNRGLLAAHIQLLTGTIPHSMSLEDISSQGSVELTSRKKLYLLDCFALQRDELYRAIRYLSRAQRKEDLQVLFNLRLDSDIEKEALDLGTKGFFCLDDSEKKLLAGLKVVVSGGLWISRSKLESCYFTKGAEVANYRKTVKNLTARECELLNLLSKGGSNEEIAHQLCISPFTVKTHLYRIYRKINVRNRHEASLWATKHLPPLG